MPRVKKIKMPKSKLINYNPKAKLGKLNAFCKRIKV